MSPTSLPAGRVLRLSVSAGGAPKYAVTAATIGPLGLAGDAHRSPSHGGPDRAVLLYAAEQIARLRALGHPIAPGAVGENVTTEGVDLAALGPGDRLQLGEQVVLEITLYPTPCDGIGGAFLHRDFTQVWHARHPGMSRLAARVLRGGRVVQGDRIRVFPHAGLPRPDR